MHTYIIIFIFYVINKTAATCGGGNTVSAGFSAAAASVAAAHCFPPLPRFSKKAPKTPTLRHSTRTLTLTHTHTMCEVQSHSVNKRQSERVRERNSERRGSVRSLVPSGWAAKPSPDCLPMRAMLFFSSSHTHSPTHCHQSLWQTSCQKYYALYVCVCVSRCICIQLVFNGGVVEISNWFLSTRTQSLSCLYHCIILLCCCMLIAHKASIYYFFLSSFFFFCHLKLTSSQLRRCSSRSQTQWRGRFITNFKPRYVKTYQQIQIWHDSRCATLSRSLSLPYALIHM